MKTFIVIVPVGSVGRHACDLLEGETFETTQMVKEHLKTEFPDDHIGFMDISDFVDDCNDQYFDLDKYFISYVYVKN